MWYTGDEEHWSPLGRSVQLIARSRERGSTGVRRMINDVPTPAVGPVQRSDTELSKACITRDRQLSSVSDRLRRIKRNIGDRYAVPPMLD